MREGEAHWTSYQKTGFAPFSPSSTVRFWGGSGLPWRVGVSKGLQHRPLARPWRVSVGPDLGSMEYPVAPLLGVGWTAAY